MFWFPHTWSTSILHFNNVIPNHALLDSSRFTGYFDRFHVEKNRVLFEGFRFRQQRVQHDATARVHQKRVRQLCKAEVDDRTKQRVERNVDTCDALK